MTSAPQVERERDLKLDSLRGFLIVLVVIGHSNFHGFAQATQGHPVSAIMSRLVGVLPQIYYFHIALFFSASCLHLQSGRPRSIGRRFALLVVPYFFWVCWPALSYFAAEYIFNATRPRFLPFVTGPVWGWLKDSLGRGLHGSWEQLKSILWFIPALVSLLALLIPIIAVHELRPRNVLWRYAPFTLLALLWLAIFLNSSVVAQWHIAGRIPWGLDVAVFIAPIAVLHRWLYRSQESSHRLPFWVLILFIFGGDALISTLEPVKTHSPYAYRIDFAQFSVPSSPYGLLGFLLLTTGLLLVSFRLPAIRWLATLGRFSMPIFLLHIIWLNHPWPTHLAQTLSAWAAFSPGSAATTLYLFRIISALLIPVILSVGLTTIWPGFRWLGFAPLPANHSWHQYRRNLSSSLSRLRGKYPSQPKPRAA
jgi:fucose 4-O-acetylase-like acetyltransferase